MLKVRLHPLFNEDGGISAESGVDTTPAAEVQTSEVTESQTGVDTQAAAEPEKQNNFEKAFAKRLAEAQTKWEKETSEKYKNYDDYRKATEYLQKTTGINDVLSLREQIELQELEDKAEQNNISPEMQRRLETLEAKAAKADEYELNTQQTKQHQEYFSKLDEFVKDKGVTTADFNQYMIENGVILNTEAWDKSLTIALKAMRADEYERKANEKESETINRYLSSKSAPRVDGSTGAASVQTADTSKLSWGDLEKRAASRIEASKTPQ
jgi:hypothetical protein